MNKNLKAGIGLIVVGWLIALGYTSLYDVGAAVGMFCALLVVAGVTTISANLP